MGNKTCGLVEGLDVRKTKGGLERLLTDRWLRVLAPTTSSKENEDQEEDAKVMEDVYALGDCADILSHELPTTAEVAVQKAKYLSRSLLLQASNPASEEPREPFQYEQKSAVAYIGRRDGVVEGNQQWTGASAWLAWRSGSLEQTRGWKRRVMIFVNWIANWVDGREVARK